MAKSPIKPLAGRVVAVREAVKQTTASGIYLPDDAQEKPTLAEVVAVGPEVKDVKMGDKIIHESFKATEVTIDGTEYLIINEEDVLATAS